MDEVYEYLKANLPYYLATVDGDAPQVRIIGTISKIEGKLYFQTGNIKDMFKQMMTNPHIAICVMGDKGSWLRVSATAVQDDRTEIRQAVIDEYPELKRMYAADDGNCEVLYLKDVTATFSSFTEAPRTIHF